MALRKAAELSELEDDRPVRVEVDGVPVCLVRVGDRVRAVHDVCTHEKYSLSDGMVWGGSVECAKHGSTFDLESGQPRGLPATEPVPVYRAEVDGDVVLVDTSQALNSAPEPSH